MRLQFVRTFGIGSGVLGVGGGFWAMAAAVEPLPPLQFVLVVAMGLSAVMVTVAAIQYVRGQARAYRRLEIAAWGLAVMSILTMGGVGLYFGPAALSAIVTLGLAFSDRRAGERAEAAGKEPKR